MVRILFNEGLACPIFQCDHCRQMIGVPHEGIAVWNDRQRDEQNAIIEVYHAHAGTECERMVREWTSTHGNPDVQPLAAHLYYLCANLEVSPEVLKLYKSRFARA